MNEMLVLAVIVAGLWTAFVWLRVPAALLFLSLLVGRQLVSEVGIEAHEFVSSVVRVNDPRIVQLTLLLLPVILSLLFLRGKLAKSKMIIEAVPLLFAAATMVLFTAPLIPRLQQLLDSVLDNQTDTYRSLIVVCAAVSILVLTWFSYARGGQDKHGKHHK